MQKAQAMVRLKYCYKHEPLTRLEGWMYLQLLRLSNSALQLNVGVWIFYISYSMYKRKPGGGI